MKKNWWKYILAAIIVIIYLLPIYVVITTSLKPITDLSSRLLMPGKPNWDNYIEVFQKSKMLRAIFNSFIITLGTVFGVVILGSLAAYPMARVKGRLSRGMKLFIMGVMMVPGMSMVVGIYSILVSMHALSTYWGIIVISITFGLPLSIYMYSNFIASIPRELDEAAEVDGAGVLRTFFEIIVPQLKPVTVSIALLQGVSTWNEYGYSLYILQKPEMYNVTLTVKQYFGEAVKDLNGAAACAVIAIIPVVIIYLFLQKYFVQGAIDSAVKG